MKRWISLTLAAGLTFTATLAGAAGFALKEQSATALGNAFAGASAAAEDVSSMFFNPAALAHLETSQTAVVLSFIAPQSEFRGGEASTVFGAPIGGGQDHSDAANDALIPAFYAAWKATDTLALGLGVNVPFGLETDYERDWVGRYHGVHSLLETVNINPAIAWRVHPMVTVGAGFQAQYANAELSNAVDFHTILTAQGQLPAGTPRDPALDGLADLEGDDWGYGWNAGILLEPRRGTRLGIAYRSKIEHTLDGDVDFTVPATFAPAFAAADLFQSGGASADLTTPETWLFGLYHEITPRWAVMAEADLTRWSRFDELRIDFDSAQPDSVTEEDWDDSWFYSLGTTWRPDDFWTLRLGIAHDETPIPDDRRTPRIPGEDRTWLALGMQWQVLAELALDFGYTHIWVKDSTIDLVAAPDNPDFLRGDLTGEYDNAIDIVTAQATWKF